MSCGLLIRVCLGQFVPIGQLWTSQRVVRPIHEVGQKLLFVAMLLQQLHDFLS